MAGSGKRPTKKEKEYITFFTQAIMSNDIKIFLNSDFLKKYEEYIYERYHEQFLKKACLENKPEILVQLIKLEKRGHIINECLNTLSQTENSDCIDAILKLIKPEGKIYTLTCLSDILFHCIENNNQVLLKHILSKKVELNHKVFNEQPLTIAIQLNKKEIVDILLEHGAIINYKEDEALWIAFINKKFDFVNKIIEKSPKIHPNTVMAIFEKYLNIFENQQELENIENIYKKLLPLLNTEKMQAKALQSMVGNSLYNMVELMIELQYNVHMNNEKCLEIAAKNDDEKMTKLLMDYGANPELLTPQIKKDYRSMHEIWGNYPRRSKIVQKLELSLKKEINSNKSRNKI